MALTAGWQSALMEPAANIVCARAVHACGMNGLCRALNRASPTDGGSSGDNTAGSGGAAASGGGGSSQVARQTTLALAVAVPIGCALVLLSVAAPLVLWWRRRQTRGPGRRGAKGAAPGADPETTLVITDM